MISFNYDTLMDRALRVTGGKRCDPRVGYGFIITGGSDLWCPPPTPGRAVHNPVRLLKPHGSLNWAIDPRTQTVDLVEEYSQAAAGSIVPPTWDKSDVTNWPWNEVWRSARTVLGLARLLIVVGYSVPVTDQLSQALLRADVNKLSALVVANPDPESRRRIVQVMSSGLDRNAVVIELGTFEEFASYLPKSPAEPAAPDLALEVEGLKRRAQRLAAQLSTVSSAQTTLESAQADVRSVVEDLESRIDELETGEAAEELKRLQSEVRDLDARIDSMLP